MKCPYCGREMEPGRIEKNTAMGFIKWKANGNWLFSKEISLTEYADDRAVKVFYCEPCRKFVIDQDDMRVD